MLILTNQKTIVLLPFSSTIHIMLHDFHVQKPLYYATSFVPRRHRNLLRHFSFQVQLLQSMTYILILSSCISLVEGISGVRKGGGGGTCTPVWCISWGKSSIRGTWLQLVPSKWRFSPLRKLEWKSSTGGTNLTQISRMEVFPPSTGLLPPIDSILVTQLGEPSIRGNRHPSATFYSPDWHPRADQLAP